LLSKEDQEDLVVALDVEIKEIEKSFVDFRKEGLIVFGHHNYNNDS
jgi:hypothetical protein